MLPLRLPESYIATAAGSRSLDLLNARIIQCMHCVPWVVSVGVAPELGGRIQSRHANMKELRPLRGDLRIIFEFDPRRMAVLLLGGDKSRKWNQWYREMIPVADQLYDQHLVELAQEEH